MAVNKYNMFMCWSMSVAIVYVAQSAMAVSDGIITNALNPPPTFSCEAQITDNNIGGDGEYIPNEDGSINYFRTTWTTFDCPPIDPTSNINQCSICGKTDIGQKDINNNTGTFTLIGSKYAAAYGTCNSSNKVNWLESYSPCESGKEYKMVFYSRQKATQPSIPCENYTDYDSFGSVIFGGVP